jgi:hypothetical protein
MQAIQGTIKQRARGIKDDLVSKKLISHLSSIDLARFVMDQYEVIGGD